MSGQCVSCGCSQPDGLLCSEDTAHYLTLLAAVPALVEQLDIAASRQARIATGGKSGVGTARERNHVNWGAVAVRDALLVEAALWGDDVDAVRRHPRADRILHGLGTAVRDAYRAIDRAQDRQYLGQCLFEENGLTCHAELWIKRGAHQVRCSQCDTVHDVPERRATLLDEAADLIVTPKEASAYVGEIGGITVGQQRIRNYLDRGRIAERPAFDGVKRFRLGDLLEILLDDAARHDVQAS